MSRAEMADYLNVDSLDYLTIEHLFEAVNAPGAGFCDACMTGNYPVPVPNSDEVRQRLELKAAPSRTRA